MEISREHRVVESVLDLVLSSQNYLVDTVKIHEPLGKVNQKVHIKSRRNVIKCKYKDILSKTRLE